MPIFWTSFFPPLLPWRQVVCAFFAGDFSMVRNFCKPVWETRCATTCKWLNSQKCYWFCCFFFNLHTFSGSLSRVIFFFVVAGCRFFLLYYVSSFGWMFVKIVILGGTGFRLEFVIGYDFIYFGFFLPLMCFSSQSWKFPEMFSFGC